METIKKSDPENVTVLERQLAELSKTNKQLSDKLQKTEQAKTTLQEQLTDRKRRVGFLKEERAGLQAEYEQLQQQLQLAIAGKNAADASAQAMQAENDLLQLRLQAKQQSHDQQAEFVAELNQQLADAQQQRALLIQQLSDFITERKKNADELADTQLSLQQRFSELAKLTELLVAEQNINEQLKLDNESLKQKVQWLRSTVKGDKK